MKKKCISAIVLLLIIIFLCYGEASKESLAEQQEAMPVITDVIVDDLKMTALCEDGSVWSWDRDQEEASACKIPNLNNIKKIMYAGPAMYALSEDGYVYAWGSNEWQQISTEEDADRNFEEAEQFLGLNDIVDMDVSVDFDSSRAKIFAIDKSGNFYAWGIYLYWDEEQDFEPGFPKKNAELVQGVSKVFAGAGNYHYFIREDGTVFSIMDNSIWESDHINDFVFPQLPLELPDLSIDASPLPLSGISYVDLREGTKYGTTILYELGQEKDIKCIDADDHTVFIAREDGTLWYWNSKMIKYHDCKDALADPESGQEDYRGCWEKVDVKEVLGITDVNTQLPHIVDICAGSENVLFLTDDGQVFMSEYVTSATEDVEYYNLESTNPNRERTKIIEDLPLKTISFQKLEWENIVSINTDGNGHFSAVDETGKYFYIDAYDAKETSTEYLFCIEAMILSIENSQLWANTPKEITIQNERHQGYKIIKDIEKFDQDNFVEYSAVNYPQIEFANEEVSPKSDKKINQIFYEMAMLHYDEQLEQEINAFYSCDYFIAFADEDYISIYFVESISSGMSSVTTYEDAVTISLKTGDKVSLEEFESIDTIMKKVDNYKGTIYTDWIFEVEEWENNKKEFIEQWKESEDSNYYGYYLYDGRVGILFNYYRTGRVRVGLEFQGIIEY